MRLKEKLASQIPPQREEVQRLAREHGDLVLTEATISMAYGGMRGIKGVVCETSEVDPDKGLIIRGIPISQLTDRIPEEVYWLLLTGELPSKADLVDLKGEFSRRAGVPSYVWKVLKAFPAETHPMVLLSAGVLALEKESRFARAYASGAKKTDWWEHTLEDSLNLLAWLPELAAGIYRIHFGKGRPIKPNRRLDWGGNFARMLGLDDGKGEFADLMRLYLTLHCDHEGGNVSAFTALTVGSSLSDVFYTVSGGLCGLAGPLHGLANQECLDFVLGLMKAYGGGVPSDQQVSEYVWKLLNSGKVVPGYGHAVLRVTDPRFAAQFEFGQKHIPEDPVFATVAKLFRLVPGILKEHGKAKSPWPNVDAASGSLVQHYGLTEFSFYTVLFGVSRALGLTAQQVVMKAMMAPIMRPKSVTTVWIKEFVAKHG